MAITEDRYYMLGVATDKAAADELSLLLRRNAHDPINADRVNKFNIPLSDGSYGACVLVTARVKDIIQEYNTNGYPQALLDAGKSNEDIDALRSVIFVDYYDLYPDGQTRTVQPNAFDDFIASKGYTYA